MSNGIKKYQLVFFGIVSLIIVLCLAIYINVKTKKEALLEDFNTKAKTQSYYLNNSLKNDVFKNNYLIVKEKIEEYLQKTIYFQNIKFEYNNFYFTTFSLLKDYPDSLSANYLVEDVTVDYLFGKITLKAHDVYEFTPSKDFNTSTNVIVKYQLYTDKKVENSLSRLNFSEFESLKPQKEYWIAKYIDIEFEDIVSSISYNNVLISKLIFKIDKSYIYEKLHNTVINTILVFMLLVFIALVFYILFYQLYFKVKIIKPTNEFNEYIKLVLKNDFQKSLENNEYIGSYNELATNLDKLSKKMAAVVNELNINRDIVERKVSSDDLTGLPNQKIFELELKGMFVASIKGYVAYLKLELLESVSKDKGNNYIDAIVEDFAHTIQNSISHLGFVHVSLYRFYGSEFAMIAKRASKDEIEKLSNDIIVNLVENMNKRYEINTSITHIGFVSFDLYGNIQSVFHQAKESYAHAKTLGDNKYFIYGEENINKKVELLENRTKEVIENGDFKITLGNNSYLFDDKEKLYMQEVIPKILDSNTNEIPIGTFVSVAEKLGKAVEFDKLVIKKVLEYLKLDNIIHKIAVNLSNESLKSQEFLDWLRSEVYTSRDISESLVLSVTSFSASLDFKLFKNFVEYLENIRGQIILKRYSYTEIPLENLEGLKIDFIRIHKDYTTGINYDKRKRQIVKNILIYGELNDIIILGDSVKAKDDYDLLDRLGLHATSL